MSSMGSRQQIETIVAHLEYKDGRCFAITTDHHIVLGRSNDPNNIGNVIAFRCDSDDLDILIGCVNVSEQHARIYSLQYDPDAEEGAGSNSLVYCEDLQSTNGTWLVSKARQVLVGRAGSSHSARLLNDGDIIRIKPDYEFVFRQEIQREMDLNELQIAETQQFVEDFQIGRRVLGQGVSGTVHLATSNGTQVACKVTDLKKLWSDVLQRGYDLSTKQLKKSVVLDKKKTDYQLERNNAIHEIELLSRLSHVRSPAALSESLLTAKPNIVQVLKVYESPHTLYMFTELALGGDLFSFLHAQGGALTEAESLVISRQVAKAVDFLHEKHSIAHRDIKPENILLTRNDAGHRVLLSDFGLACGFSTDKKRRMKSYVGTEGYIAPEILNRVDKHYTQMIDLYSLGIVIVTMLSGDVFITHQQRQTNTQETLSSQRTAIFKHPSSRAQDLVNRLIQQEPHLRPTAAQALAHGWFHADGLSRDLDECEARALRHWSPRIASIQQLPDVIRTIGTPTGRADGQQDVDGSDIFRIAPQEFGEKSGYFAT